MNEPSTWAVQYSRYGGPEVLDVATVARPRPARGEVLVEVAAFSINTIDLLSRRGRMRGLNGVGFPKGSGVDFAGVVAEVGPRTTGLARGDRVWGYLGMKPPGSHAAAAQFVTIRADQLVAAPEAISLVDAAALPLAGLTALTALRVALADPRGARVLVVGGSGGVGTATIQVAGALGARADAVAGARGNAAELAGAERVYDYRSTDPGRIDARYDAIVATSSASLLPYRRLAAPSGRLAALNPAALPAILASTVTPGPRIRMVAAKQNVADLVWLARAIDAGEIAPIIDATYPVSEIAAAHRDAESGPAGGKRVVRAP